MDRVEQYIRGRPAKRRPAAKQFIKHHAQAVLVAGRQHIGLSSLSLLRSEIGWRAEDHARGQRELARIRPVGNTKVHQVNSAMVVDTDVRRLDITVDNPLSVGVGQRLGQFSDNLHSSIKSNRAFSQLFGQATTLMSAMAI